MVHRHRHSRIHRRHGRAADDAMNHTMTGLMIGGGFIVVVFLCALLRCRSRRRSAAAQHYLSVAPEETEAVRRSRATEAKVSGSIGRLKNALRRQQEKLATQRDETTLLTARQQVATDDARTQSAAWNDAMARGRDVYGDAWDAEVEGLGVPMSELMDLNKQELAEIQRQAKQRLAAAGHTHAGGAAAAAAASAGGSGAGQAGAAPALDAGARRAVGRQNAALLAREQEIARLNQQAFREARAQELQINAINKGLLGGGGGDRGRDAERGPFESSRASRPPVHSEHSEPQHQHAANRFQSSRSAAQPGTATAALPPHAGRHYSQPQPPPQQPPQQQQPQQQQQQQQQQRWRQPRALPSLGQVGGARDARFASDRPTSAAYGRGEPTPDRFSSTRGSAGGAAAPPRLPLPPPPRPPPQPQRAGGVPPPRRPPNSPPQQSVHPHVTSNRFASSRSVARAPAGYATAHSDEEEGEDETKERRQHK
jgi:hypothetical protein